MKPITVRLPDEVLTALDAYCEAKGQGAVKVTYSIAIRDALIEYLDINPIEGIKHGGARPGAGRPPKE